MGSCCRTEVDAIVLADFHSARNCFSFGPHTSVVIRNILEFFGMNIGMKLIVLQCRSYI